MKASRYSRRYHRENEEDEVEVGGIAVPKETKQERRQRMNREAATRCRDKKTNTIKTLKIKVTHYQKQNQQLAREFNELRDLLVNIKHRFFHNGLNEIDRNYVLNMRIPERKPFQPLEEEVNEAIPSEDSVSPPIMTGVFNQGRRVSEFNQNRPNYAPMPIIVVSPTRQSMRNQYGIPIGVPDNIATQQTEQWAVQEYQPQQWDCQGYWIQGDPHAPIAITPLGQNEAGFTGSGPDDTSNYYEQYNNPPFLLVSPMVQNHTHFHNYVIQPLESKAVHAENVQDASVVSQRAESRATNNPPFLLVSPMLQNPSTYNIQNNFYGYQYVIQQSEEVPEKEEVNEKDSSDDQAAQRIPDPVPTEKPKTHRPKTLPPLVTAEKAEQAEIPAPSNIPRQRHPATFSPILFTFSPTRRPLSHFLCTPTFSERKRPIPRSSDVEAAGPPEKKQTTVPDQDSINCKSGFSPMCEKEL